MEGRGAGGVARPRRGWLLLCTGIAAVLAMSWLVAHGDYAAFTMHRAYSFVDLFGRLSNLANLRRTGDIYVPFGHLAFTYPPGAILFFWPIQWVPAAHLALIWTVASLAALAGSIFVVSAALSRANRLTLAGVACWAAVLTATVFPEVTECLTYGQTATILLLFVVADLFAVRAPLKGILVGLAAAVKIYPVVFVLAWLWRRQWREALTAIASGAALTGAAAALFPSSARRFVLNLVVHGQEFQRLTLNKNIKENNSVDAVFQRSPFHPHSLGSKEALLVSLVVLAVALVSAERLHRRGLAVSATMVLLIAGPVISPVAWDHYFAFLPLLVLVAWEAGPASGLGITALAAAAVALVPWINFRVPRATTAWAHLYSIVAQNALLVAALSVVVAGLARRAGPARAATTSPPVGSPRPRGPAHARRARPFAAGPSPTTLA